MKKPTKISIASLLVAALIVAIPTESQDHSYVPKNGFVPDKETAIAIAVAVWTPIYGKDNIEDEKPYVATLSNDIWLVVGTLSDPAGPPTVGGVAEIEISKKTGCVLRVSHGA